MTANYIQGPWEIVRDAWTDDIRIRNRKRHVVDMISNQNIHMGCDTKKERDGRRREVLATAHLITTAPDGHRLAEHIDAMADDAYLVGHPEWHELVNEARALIAKVEGTGVK